MTRTRVGINGFGRMGRLVVQTLRQHRELHLADVTNGTRSGIVAAPTTMAVDEWIVKQFVHGNETTDGHRLAQVVAKVADRR